jgi:polyphosphate:AMP phosphotransferase
MFETAEVGQRVDKATYEEKVPALRTELLAAQQAVRRSGDFPVIVLFGGPDKAGKGELANTLSAWMDPRWLFTQAYGAPTDDERARPLAWRYWRDLPPKGRIGVFLSAWYSRPLIARAYAEIGSEVFAEALGEIARMESLLAADGVLILKYWLHVGKKQQKRRLKALESDPLTRWRVTEADWKHYEMYDRFIEAAEGIISRTGTGEAPWRIVEATDPRYRDLRVGTLLLDAIRRHIDFRRAAPAPPAAPDPGITSEPLDGDAADVSDLGLTRAYTPHVRPRSILSGLELDQALPKHDYKRRLAEAQARLNRLQREAIEAGVPTVLVFQGWDAAGKGGAIRRVTAALDARNYRVIPIAAPTEEERAHHYLWRFWKHLGPAGRFTIFDRSWYGRVLVERIEGFATEVEWRRAYAEITHFERQLVDFGTVLVKFWLHISQEEQKRRFEERARVPYKQWKLTDEDWRNRDKWGIYEKAVHDMIERTSTRVAPWDLIEAEDKRFARVKVLETICERLEAGLARAAEARA